MAKWLGKGVLSVDGKDIHYGDEIPKPKDEKQAETAPVGFQDQDRPTTVD